MKTNGEIEVFKCNHDSQDKGLEKQLGNKCFAIYYVTLISLDQSYFWSLMCTEKYSSRERGKWKDQELTNLHWTNCDDR